MRTDIIHIILLVIRQSEDLTDAVPVPPIVPRARITSTSRRRTKIDKKARSWVHDQVTMKVVEGGSIVEKPTDGFGEIDFKGAARRSKAKFVRLSDNTDPSTIFDLMTKFWNLEPPRLVVSVSGGAKSFTLDPKLKQIFQQGLAKVSQTPGAWIVTGGTNTGVMQLVGEALEGTKSTCIGISTYGIVTNRQHLQHLQYDELGGKCPYRVSSSLVEKGAYLDHNHTHHLMVDDGSENHFGREINFRSQFEKYISDRNVPSVLLILQGGMGTIQTIWSAIYENLRTSIVVVKESGKAADVFAYAIDLTQDCAEEYLESDEFRKSVIEIIRRLFPELKEGEKKSCCEQVIFCMTKREQFTVFQMKGESGVDEAILMALLNCHDTTAFDQLQLTLLWDRVELAREKVLSRKCEWTQKQLANAMIMSLALDRVNFVRLFLRYGVSIETILSNDVLEFLYGYAARASPTSTLKYEFDEAEYAPTHMEQYGCVMVLLCSYVGINPRQCAIPRTTIQQVVRVLTKSLMVKGDENFIQDTTSTPYFDYPYRELFFWAVLNNKQEMAMFLWEFEEEAISKALIGAELNRILMVNAQKLELQEDKVKSFESNASEFKELAFKLLDECYKEDSNRTVQLMTTEFNQFPHYTSLNLAVTTGDMEFVSHNAVQFLLNEVWTGSIKLKDVVSDWQLFFCYICPPLISQLRFYSDKACKYRLYDGFNETDNEGDEEETEDEGHGKSYCNGANGTPGNHSQSNGSQSEKLVDGGGKVYHNGLEKKESFSFRKIEKSKSTLSEATKHGSYESISRLTWDRNKKDKDIPYYKKFMKFYFATPLVKFLSNTESYFVFLCLMAYVCMIRKENNMMAAEYVLLLFVVSFTVAEIYQITQGDSSSLSKKVKEWFNSRWNRLDACAMLCFYVAFGFRMHPNTLAVGHVLLAIDGGFWVIRLLHVFYLHRILGPYVVMINRMTTDLLYFLVILSVFLLAYGVTAKSLLEPQPWDAPISRVITSITFHPYFNIYGELFTDRDPADNTTTRFGTKVINSYAEPLAWVLLGGYLLITNILLVNILIAIFNNTFNDVQEKSDQIWKFERHGLVIEYAQRVALVPPLSLIVHIALLFRWLFRRAACRSTHTEGYNGTLKSDVTEEMKEELIEFENKCVASFVRKKELVPQISIEEASFDILGQVGHIQTTMRHLDGRLKDIETQMKHTK